MRSGRRWMEGASERMLVRQLQREVAMLRQGHGARRASTLVLNADYQPISVCSLRRGINLMQANKASLVESVGRR